MNNLTYRACKKLAERDKMTETQKNELLSSMDLFVLTKRITQDEYKELCTIMDDQQTQA
ncbi:hypothetical protein ACMGD3_21770 [Lysinibacillus sphaericus]|uniref:hypothetical protein n=1 Tax=Lysinibacillus sphaericus TaxID=1421 RepID=UPI003F7A0980